MNLLIIAAGSVSAQDVPFIDSTGNSSIILGDTTFLQTDTLTLVSDSLTADTLTVPQGEDEPINSEIKYTATDSIVNDLINKKVYLYGDGVIKYDKITLSAERIIYDFNTYTVHAEGALDTAGTLFGKPVFEEGESVFDAGEMDYNFRTKKGYIREVETQISEGYLTGDKVKTTEDNRVIFIKDGEFCPCEDKDAATRFKISKLKIIKDDKIIAGPGYLSFYNIPTPLAFPFGFFPNVDKQQAGIIIPRYGDSGDLGFFLIDGGFYTPIGENFDTRILGDIYSRGSWGLSNITNYKQIYRFNGSLSAEYNIRKTGDEDLRNFGKSSTFFIDWRHVQDQKASPNSNFSANVNIGSTNNFRNNLNSSIDNYLTNTFRSQITYQQRFYNKPYTVNINASHSQNSMTQNYTFTLPEANFNLSRVYLPLSFLRSSTVGASKWYEKIGFQYSANTRNTIDIHESDLRLNNWDNIKDKFKNGVNHTASLSTSLKAGPVSINPNISYRERWHFKKFRQGFDNESQELLIDTLNGFNRNYDYNLGASATTKIYGMFTFKGDKLQAIRHTMSPSLGFSYHPDMDPTEFGFYDENGSFRSYDPYGGTLYGGPDAGGRRGNINFGLVNNLEAKVMSSKRDTTSKYKKISLLDNISANVSYNIFADSLNLSDISLRGRTEVTKYSTLNFSAVFSPYARDQYTGDVIDDYLASQTGNLASFERGNISLTTRSIGSNMYGNREPENDMADENSPILDEAEDDVFSNPADDRPKGFKNLFTDFTVPWSLNASYVVDINRGREDLNDINSDVPFLPYRDTLAIIQSLRFDGSIGLFNIVNINFTSGYDFVNKEFTTTALNVTVDLNCWELSANIVPFGDRKSYSVGLYIKSQMLKDLKLEKRGNLGQEDNYYY